GNLGDAAQPAAIAALLRAATSRSLDIRATTWMATDPYPFPAALTLGPDTILEPALLDGFDLLLLAGGGLFAPLHFPLLHPAWLACLAASGLPYGLLGVGVAQSLAAEAGTDWQALLAGAAFRSGRDGTSLAAMPGAEWLPDPVLVAGLREGGGQPRPAAPPGARPLCIVKRPAHASEASFLAAVTALGPAVDVVATEPRRDRDQCPGLRYPASMGELRRLCAEASIVVSARYHGCIAALLEGVPCLGIGPGKSATLFAELGAPERFLRHAGDLAQHLGAPPEPLPAAAFDPFRAAADATLAGLGRLLDGLTRRREDTGLN
ncbi:MAG: polysaccharide pyruvyl transferase family protein, partial [Acetobacteraceae bacterium]